MSKKTLDVIGIIATIISFGAQIVADWVDDKSTDDRITALEDEIHGKKSK